MFTSSFLPAIVLASIGLVTAQSTAPAGIWGQCGGTNWSGPTTCVAGTVCNYYNAYYSQCIPSTSGQTSTSSSAVSRSTVTPSVSTRSSSTTSATSSAPTVTSTGYQIRGVSDPVYHLYLQSLNGVPVLGPESSSGYFNISGYIRLNSSPYQYLNIVNATTSYKPLTFDSAATFTGWALEGDTIITSTSSSYGRQLNFLACPASSSGYYQLYLQTGSQTPSSSCTSQTIHLPCLC
ncbi:carbohydrate-binding module family 1 protein [Serendipita vermifera MAFF 305830]|uniref:Carbohydrate-binding module family 1 protein n=1 Tax=Serendipita vermifera MAFF 305830 TaxID=933852 RepID=A0A0C3BLW9_SERVB|nr:carbohydrate-binding module family 1 protein [Serendipita vermifera MAFF 305830]